MSIFYDKIRRKKIIETPEEKVRQFFINYITNELKYPKSLLRIEKKILNEQGKKQCRPDIVIYKENIIPFIVVECKAENVEITKDTILQVMFYNKYINAKYIVVTNKIKTFCWECKNGKYVKSKIPSFE